MKNSATSKKQVAPKRIRAEIRQLRKELRDIFNSSYDPIRFPRFAKVSKGK